ncbi:hypothetical protein PR202_gb14941 [Eleusine coracana subsp. coracana]|uniref:Uncharacterized protein n=1 Tax=Eleusine coracana subsp. coracana TaxID=191504 RepID=A0AAV5EY52_ELECO|nr:hypothetical protein QOZ80_4BG0341080 [Eleusine coracana subsp. coracana]GJN26971.1 hypothetical protein PR202_gb14941 [Eleusine coracana subsp. coracana]
MTMSTHLLLSLLATISLSCSGAAPPPPVYDTDGHELNSEDGYYVLPAVHGHGGGLIMAPHMARCPLYVAQDPNELSLGVPVRFTTPAAQKDGASAAASATTVRVSSDLSVYFNAGTTCVQTTEWHLVGHRSRTGPGVATGPVREPNPSGREKVFRIEKAAGRVGYKLVSCRDKCQDLGVIGSADKGRPVWLRASDQAHEVVFKKAPPVFSPPAF